MASPVMDVLLVLHPDPQVDAEHRERLLRQLRASLEDLDVDAVRPIADGEVPEGAKGADPATMDAILVALSTSGGVFNALIDAVWDLLGRQSARHRISVTIDGDSIELERATADQRDQLVRAFVRRHTTG
jgi:hypothetical protein